MIEKITIQHFKSVPILKINPKRINVFIGKPNTGKSNILESLGLVSFFNYNRHSSLDFRDTFKQFVRFNSLKNIFNKNDTGKKIAITIDNIELKASYKENHYKFFVNDGKSKIFTYDCNHSGNGSLTSGATDAIHNILRPFRFYRFQLLDVYTNPLSDYLLPPSGNNLFSVLSQRAEIRKKFRKIFDSFGYKLNFKEEDQTIEIARVEEDYFISFPLTMVSDTLLRYLFYFTAIESSKDSFLIFEEPEAHAFPKHTRQLAQRMVSDTQGNQFFIATHNPYILLPLLGEAKRDEVACFITYYENYNTKIKELSYTDIQEILSLEIDVFQNLESYLEVG